MTTFTLQGEVAAEDHAAVLETVTNRKLQTRFGRTAVMSSPWAGALALLICLGMVGWRGIELAHMWVDHGHMHFWMGDVILAGLVVWMLAGYLRRGGPSGARRKLADDHLIDGVNCGPVSIEADEDRLTVRFAKRRTDYRWIAFQRVTACGSGLWLETTPLSGVLVPGNAFASANARLMRFASGNVSVR